MSAIPLLRKSPLAIAPENAERVDIPFLDCGPEIAMALGSASAAFQDVVLAFFFWRQDATGGNTLECSPADRAVRACRTETAAFASEAVVSADATRRPPWTTRESRGVDRADARNRRGKRASFDLRDELLVVAPSRRLVDVARDAAFALASYRGPRSVPPLAEPVGGSFDSTKSTCVAVLSMFSPLCSCAATQLARPAFS